VRERVLLDRDADLRADLMAQKGKELIFVEIDTLHEDSQDARMLQLRDAIKHK
jgi:hypothetical protein